MTRIGLIIDTQSLTQMDFTSILNVVRALAQSGEDARMGGAGFQVVVGSGSMAKLFVEASRQPQFGAFQIPLFSEMETALAAVRAWLADESLPGNF